MTPSARRSGAAPTSAVVHAAGAALGFTLFCGVVWAQSTGVGPITFSETEFDGLPDTEGSDFSLEILVESLDGSPIPPLRLVGLGGTEMALARAELDEILAEAGVPSLLSTPVLVTLGTGFVLDFGADVSGVAFDIIVLAEDEILEDHFTNLRAAPAVARLRGRDLGGQVVATSEIDVPVDAGGTPIALRRLTFAAPVPLRTLEIEVVPLEPVDRLFVGVDNIAYGLAAADPEVEIAPEQTVASSGSTPASAVGADGRRVVTWSDRGRIHAQVFDQAGEPVSAAFRVDARAAEDGFPSAAFDAAGNVLVTWLRGAGAVGGPAQQASSAVASSILGRVFDAGGAALGDEVVLVESSEQPPSISASGDGGAVLAFGQGGRAQVRRLGQGLAAIGDPFEVAAGAIQGSAKVATASSGDFVVVWTESIAGTSGVFARFFGTSGAKNAAVLVNDPSSPARAPAVAVDALGNAVVALEQGGEAGTDVFIRRYDASGSALGSPQRVHTSAEGDQTTPSVGANAAGDFAVAWESDALPGGSSRFDQTLAAASQTGTSIVGRAFHGGGGAGPEVVVAGVEPSGTPGAPQVTLDEEDDLVVTFRRRSAGGADRGVFSRRVSTSLPTSPCSPGVELLCLEGGRFAVRVAWRDFAGRTGQGRAAPLTDDTGSFWFFDSANTEIVLKVLDATALGGGFWVFYGALSNVQYTITVEDTATGSSRSYFNPLGTFASVGDTAALPAASVAPVMESVRQRSHAAAGSANGAVAVSAASACSTGGEVLCVQESRFEVTIEWRDFEGASGTGNAAQLSDDTGYFWFFDPANVEVVVKVLDATAINGRYWVFYGALSNVEYQITVRDTVSGAARVYHNPLGAFGSVGDTEGLPGG